ESLGRLPRPVASTEQYLTPAGIAAEVGYLAYGKGDVDGRSAVDLGCGNGVLAIAAKLLGADRVVGVDSDSAALEVARRNAARAHVDVEWRLADVRALHETFETIFMNPPFGLKESMDRMEPKMVLPGDEIAVAEEFEPGDGTYERNGLVFAATPGVLFLDPENRVARVRAFNPPAELKIGDIVYGVVDDIRGMMATATILAIHGRTRQISGESEGTIHISNVSEEYTEDIHDMYRLGDIIRAKVIQVK